jgi:hypothetical protein
MPGARAKWKSASLEVQVMVHPNNLSEAREMVRNFFTSLGTLEAFLGGILNDSSYRWSAAKWLDAFAVWAKSRLGCSYVELREASAMVVWSGTWFEVAIYQDYCSGLKKLMQRLRLDREKKYTSAELLQMAYSCTLGREAAVQS